MEIGQTSDERSWFRSMTGRERRTFWGCFGGWVVDAMDVQIYSLVIPVLLSVHFAYNFGRGVGAVFPLLVGVLADTMSTGIAIAVFAGAAYAVMALAALALPETRGKQLTVEVA
jgi:hypothetical protein